MTTAEYQSLMETILKAKRKRIMAYQYLQAHAGSKNISKVPDANKQIETHESTQKALEQNNLQQARDAAHQRELAEVKNELERKIEALKQSQDQTVTTEYKGTYDYPRDTKSVVTERLEKHIARLEKELLDQRKNAASKKDFKKLEKEFSSFEENRPKSLTKTDREYMDKIEKIEQEQKTLKEQFDLLLVVSSTDKVEGKTSDQTLAILELGRKISSLESELDALKKNDKYEEKYSNLKKEIEDLRSEQTDVVKIVPDNSEVLALKKEVNRLKSELKNHKHATPVVVAPTYPIVNDDIRTFITKHRQQNVFFPNGSPILTMAEKNKIDQVANWLDKYDELDIIIKGFASNTGSQEVNQQLSKSRAETVRNYLLSIGVTANRISLEPLGIDTNATDPASARRAEIHFYLKQ